MEQAWKQSGCLWSLSPTLSNAPLPVRMGPGADDMGGSGGAGTRSHWGWGALSGQLWDHWSTSHLQWTRIPSNVQKYRLKQEQEELRGGVGCEKSSILGIIQG